MTLGNTIEQDAWAQWNTACQALGVSITPDVQEKLAHFYELLQAGNRVTNLTRITAPEDFLYRHLLDSLTISSHIPAQAKVTDVGSGAGFPAIPLAITRPDVTVVAVESVGKKCQFIHSVQETLSLPNLQCRHERSETLGQDPTLRQRMDVVTARAVAALPVLLELCLPLVKVGGVFLAMKGTSYESELQASKTALKTLGGRLKDVQTFAHPRLEGSRLLVIEKIAKTPAAYPRNAGLPGKNPL